MLRMKISPSSMVLCGSAPWFQTGQLFLKFAVRTASIKAIWVTVKMFYFPSSNLTLARKFWELKSIQHKSCQGWEILPLIEKDHSSCTRCPSFLCLHLPVLLMSFEVFSNNLKSLFLSWGIWWFWTDFPTQIDQLKMSGRFPFGIPNIPKVLIVWKVWMNRMFHGILWSCEHLVEFWK